MSSQPRFLFESCLLRIAALGSVRPIEEILAELGSGGPMPPGLPTPRAATPSRKPTAAPPDASKKKDLIPPDAASSSMPATPSPAAAGGVPEFLAEIHAERPMLAVMLEGVAQLVVEDGRLVIAVGPDAEPVRRVLEREDAQATLRAVAARALGVSFVEVRATAQTQPPSAVERVLAPRAASDPRSVPSTANRSEREDLYDRARSDPAIKRLLSEFGAQIVDVRPLDAPVPAEDQGSTGPGAEENE
jgi:hypothetical protein